ncbi:tetratricopeptide repeat protein [Haloferula rosea]|uniref:Tetratricopeptide repeat protein n=1 Tax=Haloferula rosea TaxID=490093 RepID=A0A934RFQ5_9BACT|nr:hypothetical protein [Haloferula rosea]MBK1828339.1 hypothetical protein [Haloferula rosea]
MATGDGGQGAGFLHVLYQSGHDDQLIAEARRRLGLDPNDWSAHYYLCMGLCRLDRQREARPHLDFLLRTDPETVDAQFAATFFHSSAGKWRKARPHIAAGLRLDPDETAFLTSAAIADLSELKLDSARRHIDRARQLDPDDPEIANLHIRIHAASEESTSAALQRLEEYQQALRLEPGNASLHNSIGDVYLNELEDPAAAEEHYRIALQSEPGNAQYQQDLFHAVARRSLIYRIFSIPTRTFEWLRALGRACLLQPWRLLLFLLAGKFVLGFLIWLVLATLVFWPGGKVYEWLLVSEMKRPAKASLRGMQLWYRLRLLPVWSRFLFFLVINGLLWGACFHLLDISLMEGYAFFGAFTGIHFVVVSILWLLRRAKTSRTRKRRMRRQPPPLPAQRA